MSEKERLEDIEWIRSDDSFEIILGKFILRTAFELMKGPRVLDVGCGDGFLTKEMARRYDKVVGVDGAKDKIEFARKNAPEVEFHTSLFENFEYYEKFDSIIMINILEHVDDPVYFLKKARELLTPHGEVIIFVPNALSLNRRVGKAMGIIKNYYELTETDLAVGHRRFYDRDNLVRDFLEAGFKPEDVGGVLLKPLSNKQMESWDLEVIEALYVIGEELPDYCGLIYVRAVK